MSLIEDYDASCYDFFEIGKQVYVKDIVIWC